MQVAKEGWSAQICVCTESDYSFVSFFSVIFISMGIMCASELQIVVVADVLPKSIFGNFLFL